MWKKPSVPNWFARARELAKKEWERNHDYRRSAVYLSDPAANRKIDNFITNVIWPKALSALEGTGFTVLQANNPCIRQEWHIHACRVASITLEDPKQPLMPGNYPPWYCRLEVHCYPDNDATSLRWYFSASFPESSDWRMLTDVLQETSHHGIPSQLTIRDSSVGKYHIVFEGGGTGAWSHFSRPSLEDRLALKLKAYCEFTETVSEIQSDCRNPLLLRKLIKEANHIMEI